MFRARQFWGSAILALLVLTIIAAPVGAGRNWCRADPIVRLGDTEYQIIVAVPAEHEAAVIGPLDFEIYSPSGFEQELLFVDSGFNGHGETVVFGEHRVNGSHLFVLDVPQSDRDFRVIVEVFVDGQLIQTAYGTTREMRIPIPVVNTGFDNRAQK